MGLSWLKKIGQAALTASGILEGFKAPTLPNVDTVSDKLMEVAAIIVNVEMIGAALNLPGDQKLTASVPAIAQLILRSSVMAGRPPHDQALFMDGAKDIASGMAKILNSRGS